MRRYHTLLCRAGVGQPWAIEFGAYDKADVTAERDDYIDGWQNFKRTNLKIITTSDRQADIAAEVARLNGG